MTSAVPTSTESRALKLLGQGISPEVVASALGVTPSAISQLLSREDFATKVTELRYEGLVKHNSRDAEYDALEDRLLEKMKDLLPMMFDPLKVLRAIQVINGAKRRGAAAPDSTLAKQTVINLTLPVAIINQFKKSGVGSDLVTNSNNQVIQAGGQDLITVQSSQMSQLLDQSQQVRQLEELSYVSSP